MKNIKYYSILLSIVLLGCTGKNPKKIEFQESFVTIDISVYNGWNSFLSIKVNQNNEGFLLKDEKDKDELYFSFSISKIQHDSLSTIVNKILSNDYKSVYPVNCADCGAYCVVIRNKGVLFKTKVDNLNNDSLELKELNGLIHYLMTIASFNQKKQSNKVLFESRISEFYPFPPPPKEETK